MVKSSWSAQIESSVITWITLIPIIFCQILVLSLQLILYYSTNTDILPEAIC